jgi:hypothetical protein
VLVLAVGFWVVLIDFHVVLPLTSTCHCTLGVELATAEAVKLAVWPAMTVLVQRL